jgi:Na+/glutamate symporter
MNYDMIFEKNGYFGLNDLSFDCMTFTIISNIVVGSPIPNLLIIFRKSSFSNKIIE